MRIQCGSGSGYETLGWIPDIAGFSTQKSNVFKCMKLSEIPDFTEVSFFKLITEHESNLFVFKE
jgi:hypothetical protein